MKKFIIGFLFIALAAYGATEFGDLTVTGSLTSVGNMQTQAFLSARTGIASQNGGTLRLHETDANGGSKVTIQTVTNLSGDYVLTLPPDDGTANQVLSTDGNGELSWATATGDVTQTGTQTLTNKTLTSPIIGTTATFENNASAQFFETTGNGSSKVTVAAPASLSSDVTFTLPTDNGTNGYVLQTNGSGATSWVAQSGGGVTASSTTTFTNKSIDADDNTITDIDNNEIKAAAGIAVNKLAAITASRVAISDGSGFLTTGNVDTTELLLLDGVTGTLQTTQTAKYKSITSSGGASVTVSTTSADILHCASGSNNVTYDLPSAATACSGSSCRVYTFTKTSASNTCTIDGFSTQTINGATTYTMTSLYCSVTIYTDSSNWFILSVNGCP